MLTLIFALTGIYLLYIATRTVFEYATPSDPLKSADAEFRDALREKKRADDALRSAEMLYEYRGSYGRRRYNYEVPFDERQRASFAAHRVNAAARDIESIFRRRADASPRTYSYEAYLQHMSNLGVKS